VIRFRFVHDNITEFTVKRMCEQVEVPRSSFYAWLNRTPSTRELADTVLLEQIGDIYLRSRRTYGMPRVHGQLRRAGVHVGRHRVARLMAANGLVGAHARRRWRRGRPDAGGAPDLLNRDFHVPAPNLAWVADISEFPTGEGKLHLAALRDLFHHGIVGWDTAARQDATLVVSALTMALVRTGHPADVVHHSDKGTQGGINLSSQHLDEEGVRDGETAGVDGDADWASVDAVAGQAAGASRCRASILG
jgi:putative transposase